MKKEEKKTVKEFILTTNWFIVMYYYYYYCYDFNCDHVVDIHDKLDICTMSVCCVYENKYLTF